jgi:hypothetical protein
VFISIFSGHKNVSWDPFPPPQLLLSAGYDCSSNLPFLTTLPTRIPSVAPASASKASAVRCCFSGANRRPAVTAASVALALILQQRLLHVLPMTALTMRTKKTTMTGLSPSVMMSSSLYF